MKRKGHLYEATYDFNNIVNAYNEVCRNTKNKRKVLVLKEYKSVYVSRIYNILKNKNYVVGSYNKFVIYEPKKRLIVSQNVQDKIINHLVARHILYPAILPCLLDVNVASRKNKGTKQGLLFMNSFMHKCKIRYSHFYILKCDISKFFSSINHEILKKKLLKRIKDKDALKIVFDIIDSYSDGLGIGSMTSQVLAIFYLNDMDHFIKENLKIQYYVRYQDDFLLFHPSKDYLKYCLNEITKFLNSEKLVLNNKTRIYSSNDNFVFLGKNCFGNPSKYRSVKRRLKNKFKLYNQKIISLRSLVSTIICYKSHYPNMFKDDKNLF